MVTAASPGRGQDDGWDRHVIDRSSRGADGVRLQDVNSDGRQDVVTAWEEGGVVRVYMNPGPDSVRGPWPRTTVGRVASPEDAVAADLDGDGTYDVASATEGEDRSLYVHWAPSDPRLYADSASWRTQAFPAASGAQQWMYVLPMQVDSRHGVDLVVGSKGDAGSIGWLEAPADPGKLADWRLHRLRAAGWIMSLIAHDMDGDGDADVVASDRKGERRGVFWLENPGPGAATAGAAWKEHPIGGGDGEVMFVDVADLDGDGQAEVVSFQKPGRLLVHRRQKSEGHWKTRAAELDPAPVGTAKSVQVADLDGDGLGELVLSFEHAFPPKSGIVRVPATVAGAIDASSIQSISGPAGVKFDLSQLTDVDGDGDLDVLNTEEVDGLGVVWYENPAR